MSLAETQTLKYPRNIRPTVRGSLVTPDPAAGGWDVAVVVVTIDGNPVFTLRLGTGVVLVDPTGKWDFTFVTDQEPGMYRGFVLKDLVDGIADDELGRFNLYVEG